MPAGKLANPLLGALMPWALYATYLLQFFLAAVVLEVLVLVLIGAVRKP